MKERHDMSTRGRSGREITAALLTVVLILSARVASADEAACYNWAVQNTGSAPFALQKQAQQAEQQIDQAGKGAGAKGAVGGAAAGALIGEIASDDAGKGAAWGALAGAVIARRRTQQAKAQASQQVEQQNQQAQQATAEQIDNFKKAFSVCLEAKKYMVKY